MIVTQVELKRSIKLMQTRASRAQSNLNKIVNYRNKKPSVKTIEAFASNLQIALGNLKEIAETIENIQGE